VQSTRLGISQRKFAHALGLSFQQIQRYQNGTDRIAAGRLQQLSQVLQAPPAFSSKALRTYRVAAHAKLRLSHLPVLRDYSAALEKTLLKPERSGDST
jgi:transcriptional regulator with XRE-family HTH domain